MTMTLTQQVITIAMCVVATMLTRFLPFLIFSSKKPTPAFIQYLGMALPSAVFAMLVVYCLKDISFFSEFHALPELIAIAVTVVCHFIKKNMLISIAVGTACYMLLVQFVFV